MDNTASLINQLQRDRYGTDSPEVIVQCNPIQNPHRAHPFPQDSPHLQVAPKIAFRMPPLQQPQRRGYQAFNTTDFPTLPTRFPLPHTQVLRWKICHLSCNPLVVIRIKIRDSLSIILSAQQRC